MAIREVSKEVIVKVGKPAIPVKLTLSEPSCPVVAGVVLTHGAGGDMDSSYLPRLAAALAVAGVSCVRFTCRTLHLPTRVNAVQAVLREAASSWAETAQVPCWFCAGHSMGGRAACQVAYNSWQQQQQEQEEQHEPQAEEASQDVVPLVEQTRRTKRGDQAATEQRGEQALTSEARGAMEELAKRTRGAAETNGGIADLVQETGSGGEEGPGGGGDGGGGGGGSGAQCVPLPHVEIGRDDNDAGPSATGRAPPGDPRVVGCLLLSYPLHPPDKPDELRDDPLCKLRCPLLFVRGSRDEFSRQELLAGVMKRMASTHVQVHTVEGGDHSLQVTGGKRKRRLDDAVPSPEEAVAGRETACQEDIDHLQDVLHAVITFVKVNGTRHTQTARIPSSPIQQQLAFLRSGPTVQLLLVARYGSRPRQHRRAGDVVCTGKGRCALTACIDDTQKVGPPGTMVGRNADAAGTAFEFKLWEASSEGCGGPTARSSRVV